MLSFRTEILVFALSIGLIYTSTFSLEPLFAQDDPMEGVPAQGSTYLDPTQGNQYPDLNSAGSLGDQPVPGEPVVTPQQPGPPVVQPQGSDQQPYVDGQLSFTTPGSDPSNVQPQGSDQQPYVQPQGSDQQPYVQPQGSDQQPYVQPQGSDQQPYVPLEDDFSNIPGFEQTKTLIKDSAGSVEDTLSTINPNIPASTLMIAGIAAVVAIGGGIAAISKHHHGHSSTSHSAQDQTKQEDTEEEQTYEDVQVVTQGGIEV